MKKDLIEAACLLLFWSSVESTNHSTVDIIESNHSATMFKIDASNIFKSLNRNVFLQNVLIICIKISNFVISCYDSPAKLLVRREWKLKKVTKRHYSRQPHCYEIVWVWVSTINSSSCIIFIIRILFVQQLFCRFSRWFYRLRKKNYWTKFGNWVLLFGIMLVLISHDF